MKNPSIFLVAALAVCAGAASAHDTWVEANFPLVRVGNDLELALKLGNHGNEHRDFKLASKLAREACDLQIIGPNGARRDLSKSLFDNGLDLKEGFWSAPFSPSATGLYTVWSQLDNVASYAPKRNVKTAKAFFISSRSLDKIAPAESGFERVLSRDKLEIVPLQNPVAPLALGSQFRLKLVLKGAPLPDTKISFVRRGAVLKSPFDADYETQTDARGEAKYTFREAGEYLVVAHHKTAQGGQLRGQNYDSTAYSATLRLQVARICPCCE